MASYVFDWRLAIRASDLTSTQKLVAYTIATYTDANGTGAYPSLDTLAAVADLHRVSVVRAIKVLQQKGFLDVRQGGGRRPGGGGRANVYRVLLPEPLQVATVAVSNGSPVSRNGSSESGKRLRPVTPPRTRPSTEKGAARRAGLQAIDRAP